MRTTRLAAPALVLVVAMFAAACSDANPVAPANIPGTYVLQSINGQGLPYVVPNTVGEARIVNSATAEIVLAVSADSDNTYSFTGSGMRDDSVATVLSDVGSWTQDGGKLNFVSGAISGAFYFAIATPDKITVTLPGGFLNSTTGTFSLVFVKGS